ncbi:hypothetical protein Tco_1565417 [Tanacetum coccineum]
MMARIQPANMEFDEGPSYYYAFVSEVQTPSTSYMNPLFTDSDHEQTYHDKPKIINSIIGDDQINSDIIFDDPNVEKELIEADHKAKRLETELQNQFIQYRDKIRALEKERDGLQLNVSEQRKHVLELQNAQTVLKRKLNTNEDKYLDDVLNLEEKLKRNENVNPKLYDASCLRSSKVHVNVYDTKEILEDETKSQIKMENKLKDPIAIEKKSKLSFN